MRREEETHGWERNSPTGPSGEKRYGKAEGGKDTIGGGTVNCGGM